MTGHWSKPIDFSEEIMDQAAAQAATFRNFFIAPAPTIGSTEPPDALERALEDDFDTPRALAVLHAWRRAGFVQQVAQGLEIFGLRDLVERQAAPKGVHELARARVAAREKKDFTRADSIRDEIRAEGWEIRDTSEDPGYELVPT